MLVLICIVLLLKPVLNEFGYIVTRNCINATIQYSPVFLVNLKDLEAFSFLVAVS